MSVWLGLVVIIIRICSSTISNILVRRIWSFPKKSGVLPSLPFMSLVSEWTGFKEIKEAKGDWKGYGVKKFHARWRTGTRVLLANEEHYDSFGLRLNFAFQEAVLDGERVILNVVDKAHLFSGKPSVAFYYASPRKVRNKRILFQAAQMGILFVPVSGFIKNTVGEFLKSFYRQQALTEGALAAHFAMTGEGKIKDGILHQAINPFLVW